MKEIPLNILIVDNDNKTDEILCQILDSEEIVLSIELRNNFDDAWNIITSTKVNTIFIDPLNFNLDKSSEFIFTIRKKHPEIVFVLYLNQSKAERNSSEFYRGDRSRFTHYYKLDKQTPIESFEDELSVVFFKIQSDLSWRMSKENIANLREEAKTILKGKSESPESRLIKELKGVLDDLQLNKQKKQAKEKTVFFSNRFAEEEYIEGLTNYLQDNGFIVITGKSANTYISKAIVQRIRDCEFFLCLMTRDKEKNDGSFTTSPWLLEEKGVAIAYEKPIVLMIEEGINDFGGLQGDWQRIHFTPKGFLLAAQEAVKQLKSYTGDN
jgi:hypothetical protein